MEEKQEELNERDLQEWIEQNPEALGEDLLIIQKEFDGFAGTRERLDLLALDKEGRLVVIENKRDDSGRHVVWQALKYVAYCSTLKKKEILKIYQMYLDCHFYDEDANRKLCEFLDVEDLEKVALNRCIEQRLILVAAKFPKEVTSALLYLIKHGIRAQCFEYYGKKDRFNLQKIIPTLKYKDHMISGIADISGEESMFQEFWKRTLEVLKMGDNQRYGNITPSKRKYQNLGIATGEPTTYGFRLHKVNNKATVDLYLGSGEKVRDEHKRIFDQLKEQEQDIQERFGSELKLDWVEMSKNKPGRILYSKEFDGYNEEDEKKKKAMVEWLCEHIVKLERAFEKPLGLLSQKLESRGTLSVDDP